MGASNINRISSAYSTDQAVYYMNNNLLSLSQLQQKISSGHNINTPADNPVGLTQILNLSNALSADERYTQNITAATTETGEADSVMSQMTDIINQAKQLATEGANFDNNQTGLNALADQVDEMISQMVQLGNTNVAGKYIFGGMVTNQPPFTRVGDNVTYSGTPPTESFARPVEISQNVTVNVNVNGQNLLGNDTVTNPATPTFSASSGGVFQTLVELKLNLQNGQTDQVRQRIDDLSNDLNTVLTQQTQVGAIENQLTMTQNRINDRKTTLTQQYSDIQTVNMPEAISNLNAEQDTFQASLGVAARVLQTSILNYLTN